MDAKAIVTIYFRDGSLESRDSLGGLHVDKRGSSVLLTIDGRSDSYANVTTIDVSLVNSEHRQTELVA
jgi:hypothetical protein